MALRIEPVLGPGDFSTQRFEYLGDELGRSRLEVEFLGGGCGDGDAFQSTGLEPPFIHCFSCNGIEAHFCGLDDDRFSDATLFVDYVGNEHLATQRRARFCASHARKTSRLDLRPNVVRGVADIDDGKPGSQCGFHKRVEFRALAGDVVVDGGLVGRASDSNVKQYDKECGRGFHRASLTVGGDGNVTSSVSGIETSGPVFQWKQAVGSWALKFAGLPPSRARLIHSPFAVPVMPWRRLVRPHQVPPTNSFFIIAVSYFL